MTMDDGEQSCPTDRRIRQVVADVPLLPQSRQDGRSLNDCSLKLERLHGVPS